MLSRLFCWKHFELESLNEKALQMIFDQDLQNGIIFVVNPSLRKGPIQNKTNGRAL